MYPWSGGRRKKLTERVADELFLGTGDLPWEYLELKLCRDVYHCLPSELDQEEWLRIKSHIAVMEGEAKVRK